MYLLSAFFPLLFVSVYAPTLVFKGTRARGVLVISYLACRGGGRAVAGRF